MLVEIKRGVCIEHMRYDVEEIKSREDIESEDIVSEDIVSVDIVSGDIVSEDIVSEGDGGWRR